MKVIISERQFKNLISTIFEVESGIDIRSNEPSKELRIDDILKQGITDDVLSNFERFNDTLKSISLTYGPKSATRQHGLTLTNILTKIVDDNVSKLILKISKFLPKEQRRGLINKLLSIIVKLGRIDNDDMVKDIVEKSIKIIDDERFDVSHEKDLIKFITEYKSEQSTNFDQFLIDFFNKISLPSAEYEESFQYENLFKLERTSPRITIKLRKDYTFDEYGIQIKKIEFDSIKNDIGKVLYIIEKMVECENCDQIDSKSLINKIMSEISFSVAWVQTKKNTKRDLTALQTIKEYGRDNILLYPGDGVEVKFKPYNKKDFLSEFFKVDASKENKSKIMSLISKMKGIGGSSREDLYKTFMELLVNRLNFSIGGGKNEILKNIISNLGGMIFENDIFVKSEDINFDWGTTGHGGRDRLSITYEVKPGAPIYNITRQSNVSATKNYNKISGNFVLKQN